MKNIALTLILTLLPLLSFAQGVSSQQEVSVAGFIPLEGSGRMVYNFNPGWRFFRGDVKGAEKADFDDKTWEVVSTPHSVQLMPAEASGCRNYQGIAWYRKHFTVPAEMDGMEVLIHFEAIMGKQKIYVNGNLVKEHLGGYLPVTVSLTEAGVKAGDKCVIAVMADNSDDKDYPPGKTQYTLDFAYHGGIYRDVWMIGKSQVAITDAIEANKVADGGVFVHFDNLSEQNADVYVNTNVKNSSERSRKVTVETTLTDADGKIVKKVSEKITLNAGADQTVMQKIVVKNPNLWSPNSPYLYRVESRIKENGRSIDGGITRVGIRWFEFDGKKGFFLNGKPYGQLVGANRHQDFAYVGNAVPNSQQWRDARLLRDAG